MDLRWLGPYEIAADLRKGFYAVSDVTNGDIAIKRVNGAHLKAYNSNTPSFHASSTSDLAAQVINFASSINVINFRWYPTTHCWMTACLLYLLHSLHSKLLRKGLLHQSIISCHPPMSLLLQSHQHSILFFLR